MRKKQTPSQQDPKQLNAVIFQFMQAFLLKFAKINYEGKIINVQMLNVFTNCLQYLSENILKKQESFTNQTIKAIIDIAITVEFNFHMTEELLTSSFNIQPVIRFLQTLFNFVDKLFIFQQKSTNDKIAEVMDLFWPLLASEKEIQKVQVKQFDKIASALQKISNLPYILDIEPYCGKISFQAVMNECVSISFLQQNLQFSTIFRSVLSKYNQKNRGFIQSFLTYFQSLMNRQKDYKDIFHKCFNLLINISNSVGQKYNYVEIFFNRLISSANPIRNFTYAITSMPNNTGIQKYYSNHHLLTLSFIIIQKILNQKAPNKQSAKALEIIAKLSHYWIDLTPQSLNMNDFRQKINSNLLFKFIKFVIPTGKIQSNANPLDSAMIVENSIIEAQKAIFESGELDSKKIYEFFKQCQMRSDSQEGDQWDNSNRTAFGKIDSSQKIQINISSIKNFSIIIENLSKNKSILPQLKLNSVENLQELLNETFSKVVQSQNKERAIYNEISSFITKCFPNFIPDDWNETLLKKSFIQDCQIKENLQKSTQNQRVTQIIQSLLIKKLQQTETFSKMKQQFSFQEFIDKIFSLQNTDKKQILNFHFLIFYILLKKCSSLPQKQEISQLQSITLVLINKLKYFVEQQSNLVQRKENFILEKLKKSMLILKFFLIMILDHPSSSFKLSLKKIFTLQGPKVSNVMNLFDLIIINQKQTVNSFFNSRTKLILGSSEEGQNSLSKIFLSLVQKINEISFPENYLRSGSESKEQKKMRIFLNIKLNNISLSLKKTHKVPELIQNINLMRKTNSINSFEILLCSFCEFFDQLTGKKNVNSIQIPQNIELQKRQKLPISESQFIVAFNYLLKINILTAKFNQNFNEETQSNLSDKIYGLQDIHSLIQQTLTKIQQLIFQQNQTFDLKTLIKIYQNIKDSTNSIGGIAQKYNQLVNEGQMIRLISELTEDSQKLRIQFSQLALITMKKLLSKDQKINQKIKDLQKVKLQQQKLNKMENQNQEKDGGQESIKPSQMKDLSAKLKQLYLMYYPYKHDLNLGNMLKVKIEVSMLQLLQDYSQNNHLTKQNIETLSNSIVEDLLKNISIVKEIIIKQNQQISNLNAEELIWNFKYADQTKFISFIVKSILKMFSNQDKDKKNFQFVDKIFSISSQILDNQVICGLARKQIGNDLSQQFVTIVSSRIEEGCLLVEKSCELVSPKKTKKGGIEAIESEKNKIKDFHTTSTKLYNIIKKVINLKQINSEQIVSSLILKDCFNSIEVTQFLLTELINVSTFIKTNSDNVTETVFSYVIKAYQSYHEGKNKLQIPEFLCQFFNISHADNFKNQIQILQKSERSTATCTSNIFYRCLKCDDKKIICYSCAVECHKGHPVIYLSQQKFPKCQCRQIGAIQCKLVKKAEDGKILKPQPFKSMFSYESKQPMRANRHQFFMMEDDRMHQSLLAYQEDDFRESYRHGRAIIRKPRQFQSMERENIFSMDPLDRPQNLFDRQLVRQQKKIEANQKAIEENFDFEDQNYSQKTNLMETQDTLKYPTATSIQSQSYLLPVFLQMFNEIYSGNEEASSFKISSQTEKFGFNSVSVGKIMNNAWRASNSGSYTIRLKKQNQLNNKSPAVSKQIIAQNSKFILVASGSMIFVHSKERYFLNILDGKQTQSLQNTNQFTGNFDIHTIDFSPLDDSLFVIAGLHNIIMLNISNDGVISKNTQQQRVNVNNDYINKVRTSSLGVFYSTSYEIKLLNWSFKPILVIKSSADCLLKEWCLYEKSAGCTVYCVTAHGYTEYIDVAPADQGKKVFTNKVLDGRKSIQTGASILVKDVQKIGKVYLASFKDKDGSNIIGNLQGDTVQNPFNFLLRNNFVDHFGKKYLIGQSEIIKGSQNQIFVVCTIREPLTPQNSIGQGQLTVFHVRKDKKCEFQLINTDNKCENFSVIPVGDNNWSIISIHDDGSLHFSVLQKPQKQVIEQQCKKLKQMAPVSYQKNIEKYSQLKQAIKKTINQETLSQVDLHPVDYFREISEMLKNNTDYKFTKKNLEYDVTITSNNKVVTGFTLPFIGNVYLPHRTIKNTVQVGLSNLEVLHYFVQGSIKFRVEKIQDYRTGMENMNQKFKQKLQRFQRLQEMAMDSERAMHILNTIKQVQSLGSDQVQFYGQSVDSFKGKISNFAEIFNQESTQPSKDKKVQKMAIILEIFIQDSIKNQNYLCQPFQILEFVRNLRKISIGITKPQISNILKNLIVSSLKMHEAIIGGKSHVFNDEYYPLKYATQQKANISYEILKDQISESQVEESINFWNQICNEDLSLCLLYLSKYPSLLAKIHKKSKQIGKIKIKQKLLKLYVLGYQVLVFKDHNCKWILGGICSLFTGEQKNKDLRETFYQILMKYSNVELPAWLKNVQEVDGQENVSNVNLVPKVSQAQQPSLIAQDNMAALYGQFDMGEMDEDAMIKMAIQMSKIQMRQNQQNNFGFNNANNLIEQQKDNEQDHAMLMENQVNHLQDQTKRTFLKDLVEHCTKDLTDPSQITASKIIVLYVVSKYVNKVQDIPVFNQILQKITKILGDLSPSCDNLDKHILMAYLSIFSNILSTSKILKNNLSETAADLYIVIRQEVLNRLQNVKPQKVNKLKNQPNLMGKIFKGEKIYTFAHYAYGLISLLLPPCEPLPILLSLECYWILPQSKQFYTKLKYMTTIKEGISTENIDKVYEVAKLDPEVWRQNADIVWLQSCIEGKKLNWEKALQLLAIYYENQMTPQ